MRIIEKIEHWKQNNPEKPFFSFEYFPPRTDAGLANLYDRFDRMAVLNPLWIDVTWGAGGSTAGKTLEMCANAVNYHGLEPLMHLTCTNMHLSAIDNALTECTKNGIVNILALRGDPPANEEKWSSTEGGFEHAVDLVKYIKKKHGNTFCIGVAGYPEGHLENPKKEDDLMFLKEKVDAGADFVITQLFYDINEYINFDIAAKSIGIEVVIIPGIMPIQSYAGFMKMTGFCKTKIPIELSTVLEEIKDDEQKVKDFGVHHGTKMCQDLINYGVSGLHFYTLNLESSVIRIVEGLNLIDIHRSNRELPWRPLSGRRAKEDVRPIFWSNRPKSYIERTSTWDDFPNGRWGSIESPAFGEPTLSASVDPDERSMSHRRSMWGEKLTSIKDVEIIFCKYLKNDEHVKRLPWCFERPGAETVVIQKQLLKLNMCGLLTINSQPRVNGSLSTDPNFGWGPKGGFVYQKAYIEFFCAPEVFKILVAAVKKDPELTMSATKKDGDFQTNSKSEVNAVTWGAFPGEEIKQPTIVDTKSFLVWKNEAFDLWTLEWASIYSEGSQSKRLLTEIRDTWYLANIVDNNFVSGDLFGKLVGFLQN
ncbi:putative Methylenetetrahydrofolate reductase 1 [Cardiosporidium cionae]|uniref:methylenetetrahydrofolate reductase (NADH) n=1 Tax=Cardiosporidium cionae TaxID=476202 RepID=A0ABQ7J538_9APIC|nr:putative Methylenetetrahydrofolate reductase 1 [Cardiosporidium cionae]|eukprot:KAF8819103.1 putative Methylenetetrahydrofolate reductase 1 [Cardiosporidium cionae]